MITQKAKLQKANVQSQSVARQGGGVAVESPQSEQIAQLEAMIASSPQAEKQRELAAKMNTSSAVITQRKSKDRIVNSPRQLEMRKLVDGIHNSPKMMMQRKQHERLFSMVQRMRDEDPLQVGIKRSAPFSASFPTLVQQKTGASKGAIQTYKLLNQEERHNKLTVLNIHAQRSILSLPSDFAHPVQRRTLRQAGRDGGLGESPDTPLIGGNVGPDNGKAYVQDLGVQATKPGALAASGAGYANFVNDKPIDDLLSVNNVFSRINTVKPTINAYIQGLNGDAATTVPQVETHIKNNIISPSVTAHVKDNVTAGELTEILGALRNPVTKNGANRFFANPLGDGVIKGIIKAKINAGWRENANVLPIDPFLYGARTSYGGTVLRVFYQHSPDWPGYVTYIDDGAEAARMRLNGPINNAAVAGVPDEFGRKHHETGNANLAGDITLNAADTRLDNERRWDTMTKLAGEGARFVCVRNNINAMTDKSRFYVLGVAEDDPTYYVTLEDLWSSWAAVFNKQNNIANVVVRAAIVGGNNWTYDQQGGQAARIFSVMDDPPMGASDVDLT